MAKSKHDELADALARMHDAEAEHEPANESHAGEPSPAPAAPAQPSSPARPASPSPRPSMPPAPTSARQRPAAPGRAATPVAPIAQPVVHEAHEEGVEQQEEVHDTLQARVVPSSRVEPARSTTRPASSLAASKRAVEHKRTM